MKITVEFNSLEEFMEHMKTEKVEPVAEKPRQKAQAPQAEPEEEKPENLPMNPPEPAEKPVDTGTGAIVGATPEEMKQIEAEEKPVPTYVLADAQKAVREVVKTKGKDVAKEILGHYKHKDKEDGSATGASALKPEDYAAAIRELEEALNG